MTEQLPDIGNYAFSCTNGGHQYCNGEVDYRDYRRAPLPCDCPCHMDKVKLG